ncbi:MAG: hypothetical protein FWE03_04890 [Firmicutes bacterium]|nr:hypothetical protein [Bacillota bacterium]
MKRITKFILIVLFALTVSLSFSACQEVIPFGVRLSYINTGLSHNLAIDADGNIWAWGNDRLSVAHQHTGKIGDGNTIDHSSPIQITQNKQFYSVFAARNHSIALDKNGGLWTWGLNDYGQLGNGIANNIRVPTQILNDTQFLMISYNTAIDINNNLWTWGANNNGQLGNGSSVNHSSNPMQIANDNSFLMVSSNGNHSLAIDINGHLWAWGLNNRGQLGDGTTINRFYPVQIMSSKTFSYISAGGELSLAIDSQGFLWVWGFNRDGQVGDGTTITRINPVQIMQSVQFISISAGSGYNLALDKDGNIWAWGNNHSGNLGDGTTRNRNIPVMVEIDANIYSISAGTLLSFAIDTDGNLWAWGSNQGRFGNGTNRASRNPIMI